MLTTSYFARPTEKDFDVGIVSNHPKADGQKLRYFSLDGIKTVGVLDGEPFELRFHNKSSEDVSVRATLDGQDIMTAKPANLDTDGMMWLVRAGKTLHLKAWHESGEGGSRLVFTGKDKSVAIHNDGDASHIGIIAFAVFMEREAPRRPEYYTHGIARRSLSDYSYGDYTKGGPSFTDEFGRNDSGPIPCAAGISGSTTVSNDISSVGYNASMDLERSKHLVEDIGEKTSGTLSKQAAVGAGEYVSQKTRTVKGLTEPVLNTIVRMRYMFWSDLEDRLKAHKSEDKHATGFPAEKIKVFADLSKVPHVMSEAATRTEEFSRTY
jgi:hypothetical protein